MIQDVNSPAAVEQRGAMVCDSPGDRSLLALHLARAELSGRSAREFASMALAAFRSAEKAGPVGDGALDLVTDLEQVVEQLTRLQGELLKRVQISPMGGVA